MVFLSAAVATFAFTAVVHAAAPACNDTELAYIRESNFPNASVVCALDDPNTLTNCLQTASAGQLSNTCIGCYEANVIECSSQQCVSECFPNPSTPACISCGETKCFEGEFVPHCTDIGNSNVTLSPTAMPTAAPTAPQVNMFPYAFLGVWESNAFAQPSYYDCYFKLNATSTDVELQLLCTKEEEGPEFPVEVITMTDPPVVACGQNQQIGQAYGVIGGVERRALTNSSTCIYFSRIDSEHVLNSNAILNVAVFAAPAQCSKEGNCCLATSGLNSSDAMETIQFTCASGVCLTDTASSYCNANSDAPSHQVYQIGIGMSVGGIGLLVTTLILIIVISHVVQG